MTDEQYIDWLFQQEPCGYQNTPGFRAFLLDAMAVIAVIGERPRAGDVASMHMAYTAGQEHGNARTWTDERPTEPGEYWVSIPPQQRKQYAHKCVVLPVRVKRSLGSLLVVGLIGTTGFWAVTDTQLNGAKWSRRETPADPFEEVTT